MTDSEQLTIIIPCYKSAEYLQHTVEEILEAGAKYKLDGLHLILVDDGSPDGTGEVIRSLCSIHEDCITGILLAENAGQAQARMAGIDHVPGGDTVFMDDDGQHDPAEIPRLAEKLREGYDIVYAQFPKIEESAVRKLGSHILNMLLTVCTRKPRKLRISSFLIFNEAALRELQSYRSSHPFIGGWLFRHGYRAAGIPVQHRQRQVGSSGYTLKKLFLRAVEMTILYRIPSRKDAPPPYRIREIIGGPDTS